MRRPLISAATVLLLVGAAGCSSSGSETDPGPGSGSAPGSSSTVPGDGSQTGSSPSAGGSGDSGGSGGSDQSAGSSSASSPPAGVLFGADSLPSAADHCRTKNLTAVARGTGQGRASVTLTNRGDGSCTVQGFPSLLFLSEAGRTELPVDWAGSAADAEKITLAPGDSASAALTFTSLDECDAVTGLDIVPPGESRPRTPSFTTTGGKKKAVRICDTGVRVKAFSPS